MAFCAKCGSQYDETVGGCPQCAQSPVPGAPMAPGVPVAFTAPTDRPSLMVYGGAALLLIGTFLPILSASTPAILVASGATAETKSWSLLGGAPAGGEGLFSSLAAVSKVVFKDPTAGFQMIGILLALAAVASCVVLFMKVRQGLWIAGGVALAVIAYGFFTMNSALDGFKAAAASVGGSSGKLIADAFQPGWGWVALLVGAGLVLAAAYMKQNELS